MSGRFKKHKRAHRCPELSPVGRAADFIAHSLVEQRKGMGFASLTDKDDPDREIGIVLVCLTPELVIKFRQFVEDLGNYAQTGDEIDPT